jgi:hypothetical protein
MSKQGDDVVVNVDNDDDHDDGDAMPVTGHP